MSEREPAAMREMMDYAKKGDIEGLYSSIQKYPQLLQDIDKIQFVNTPLHEAAAAGRASFAIEIMNLMPSLGKKLNPEGHSPLHVALKEKQTHTAEALVRIDKQLVRVKGKEGLTPLHYAVKMKTDLDLLASFLLDCPDSIDDLNSRFQTAVHIAFETNNCPAIILLLNWLARRAKEPVLGWRDEKGNTALHVAVQHDCVQGVKIMVNTTKINKRNSNGKTPLDIAEECDKKEMVKVLKQAGARRATELPMKQPLSEYLLSHVTFLEKLLRGYSFMLKDLTNDMRSVVLVVAVLIATATYQAVLQPPGGVYQGEAETANRSRIAGRGALQTAAPILRRPRLKHAGKMVMEKPDYNQFMPANTVAFTLSMVIIIFVLHGRPYNIILHTCLIFLAHSYLIAMAFISDSSHISNIMFFVSWFVIAFAFAIKMLYYMVKALFEDVWWLPRFRVKSSNVLNRVEGEQAKKTISGARKLRMQYKLLQN
ncbi:hypothetical protein Pfo_025357 [Paulownia fortunei]|nr:hypothetical protein Pfo_025357 [Paulownia fortunei]